MNSLPILLKLIGRFIGIDAASLKDLAVQLAKKEVGAELKAKLDHAVKRDVNKLTTAHKALGPNPTDAEKATFCHVALFQLWKGVVGGGTPADALRDAFLSAVTKAASPHLAGVSLQQDVQAIADAQVGALLALAP